jgi:hypothetical protein
MQNQIKFYYGNAIDRGGRIALGDLMPKCNSVFVLKLNQLFYSPCYQQFV